MKKLKYVLTGLLAVCTMTASAAALSACKKEEYPIVPPVQEPDDDTVEQEITVSISNGNSVDCIEGQSVTLTAVNSKSPDSFSWKSEDSGVLSVITNADGSATVTAGYVDEQTSVAVTYTAAFGNIIKSANCTIIIKPLAGSVATTYTVASNPRAVSAVFANESGVYGYKESVQLDVAAEDGWALTAVKVNGEMLKYSDGDYTFEDGLFKVTFVSLCQSDASEIELTFDEISVTANCDEGYITLTLPQGTVKMGARYTFTAALKDMYRQTMNVLLYINGELVDGYNGGEYSFDITDVHTTLTVSARDNGSNLNFNVVRDADVNGTSNNKTLEAYYSNAVMIADIKYSEAVTDSEYQFGVRIYNETTFVSRFDLRYDGSAMTLLCSASPSKVYTYTSAADVKSTLAGDGLTVIIVRDYAQYTVYTDNGSGNIEQAFEVVLSGETPYTQIGFGLQPSIAEGNSVQCVLSYSDGSDDWRAVLGDKLGGLTPDITVTTENGAPLAGVEGLESSYNVGSSASFEVTTAAELGEGYMLGAVKVNGVTVVPEDGIYTVKLDAKKFDIDVTVCKIGDDAVLEVVKSNCAVAFSGDNGQLKIGDALSFTVQPDEYYAVTRVLFNGEEIAADNGVYEVNAMLPVNSLTVETQSRIYSHVHSANANSVWVTAGNSADSILFVNLHFTDLAAISGDGDAWCVDIRLNGGDESNYSSRFFALSMVWKNGSLYLSNRAASGVSFADPAKVIQKLASEEGYNLVLVREGGLLKVYAEDCNGGVVYMNSFNTALGNDSGWFAIGYEASATVSGSLSKNEVEAGRTRIIGWTNYDGYTEQHLEQLMEKQFNGSLQIAEIPPEVNVTMQDDIPLATVAGLENSYTVGSVVSFTVELATEQAGYFIENVTLNGETLSPVEGVYSATLTKTGLVIGVTVGFNDSVETSLSASTDSALVSVVPDSDYEEYIVGEEFKFTVEIDPAVSQFRHLDGVTFNGSAITPDDDGVYTVVLEVNNNDIQVTTKSAEGIYSAATKTSSVNNLADEVYDMGSSPNSILAVKASYAEAATNTAEYRLDIRLYGGVGGEANDQFLCFSVKNVNSVLYLGFRDTFDDSRLCLNAVENVKQKLADGLTFIFIKSNGKIAPFYTVYILDGESAVYIGELVTRFTTNNDTQANTQKVTNGNTYAKIGLTRGANMSTGAISMSWICFDGATVGSLQSAASFMLDKVVTVKTAPAPSDAFAITTTTASSKVDRVAAAESNSVLVATFKSRLDADNEISIRYGYGTATFAFRITLKYTNSTNALVLTKGTASGTDYTFSGEMLDWALGAVRSENGLQLLVVRDGSDFNVYCSTDGQTFIKLTTFSYSANAVEIFGWQQSGTDCRQDFLYYANATADDMQGIYESFTAAHSVYTMA